MYEYTGYVGYKNIILIFLKIIKIELKDAVECSLNSGTDFLALNSVSAKHILTRSKYFSNIKYLSSNILYYTVRHEIK